MTSNQRYPTDIENSSTQNTRLLCSHTLNIGIKHAFLCINICWTLRVMLKPELEGRGFNDPRDLADVNVTENHV